MNKVLNIDMEIGKLLTSIENEEIEFDVFDRRMTVLESQRELEEKQQEYINEQWEQERENQISMSRGGL